MPHIPRQPLGEKAPGPLPDGEEKKSPKLLDTMTVSDMKQYDKDPAEIAKLLFGEQIKHDPITGGLVRSRTNA